MRRRVFFKAIALLVRTGIMAIVLMVATARSSRAQGTPAPDHSELDTCFGFSFGPWTPPLNWELAGHGPTLDSARVPRAPGGRGWAATDVEQPSEPRRLS